MNLAITRLEEVLEKELKEENSLRKEADWAFEAYQRSLKALEVQQDYVDELKQAINLLLEAEND